MHLFSAKKSLKNKTNGVFLSGVTIQMNLPIRLAFAFFVSIIASLSAASPALAQEYVAPPLSAYGQLPGFEDAALSPSGERTATVVTIDGKRMLLALDKESQLLTTFAVDDMKIRTLRWVGEDRILLTYSTTKKLGFEFVQDKAELTVAVVIPIDPKEKIKTIFADNSLIVSAIWSNRGVRKIDGRWYGFFDGVELARARGGLSFAGTTWDHGRPHLFKVDLETNKPEKIANAPLEGFTRRWRIGPDGEVAAVFDIDNTTGEWAIRNGDYNIIVEGVSKTGDVGLLGLGKDGKSILFVQPHGDDETEAFEVPVTGGEPELFLPDVDIEGLVFDPNTGYFMGYFEGENVKPVFEDEVIAAPIRKVQAAFKQLDDVRIMDWSDDFGNFIVRTTSDQDSGTWYAVDVNNLSARALGYERMAIGPGQVGDFSVFEYTASDGTEMDGILTLPPGRDPTNLPVIVHPHGGPHSHDSERFDWWAQAFASRGYAVFQPNFRGSTNRDRDFRRAGYGEWGRKMQTDISDGVSALAEAGIIDPSRACIVGASYGGYAALAGVILQEDLYRCAVAVAPVVDIDRIYRDGYAFRGRSVTKNVLLRQLGDPSTWSAVSPQRHAGRANAPILLIHGKDDTVVPFDHSEKMADALKDAGKEYEFVTLEGEDHWLSLEKTRMEMLEATMRFVQKHNPSSGGSD